MLRAPVGGVLEGAEGAVLTRSEHGTDAQRGPIDYSLRLLHHGRRGRGRGGERGFTTCWVSQVSFEPQQVVVAVRRDQHTHELMEQGGVFSLNFLDTEQEDLAAASPSPWSPETARSAARPTPAARPGPRSSRRSSPT